MSEAFLAQLPWICETCTLGWANDEVAQQYLIYLLKRVNIILPRRKWHIGTFKEFYPRGQKLLGLNVNQGGEVCIRFRDPAHKHLFLPFHEVLCTTLHELAHCKVRRHDRTFWSLYYDLVRECEALEAVFIDQGVQLYPHYIATTFTFNTIGTNNFTDVKNSNDNNYISNNNKNKINYYDCSNAGRKQSVSSEETELSYSGHNENVHVLEETTDKSVGANKNQSTFTKFNIPNVNPDQNGSETNTKNTNKKSKRVAIKMFAGRGHKLGGQRTEVINRRANMSSEETRRLLTIRAIELRQSRLAELEMSSSATTVTADHGAVVQRSTESDTIESIFNYHIPDDVNMQSTISSEECKGWACPRCTFINETKDVICVMCTDELEDDIISEVSEHNNSHTNTCVDANKDVTKVQEELWECQECTFINQSTQIVCAMCNIKQNENACSSHQRTALCDSKRVYEVIDCDAISDSDNKPEHKEKNL